MAERPTTRQEVGQAIDEFAAVIDEYSSPVHYAVSVSEEKFQADKHRALEEQRRPLPLRNGGP